jgi:hypothetical protein
MIMALKLLSHHLRSMVHTPLMISVLAGHPDIFAPVSVFMEYAKNFSMAERFA